MNQKDQAQEVPKAVTLDRLFDATASLFWENGFATTTTREIAAKLGIRQASLYYHVESKEDLLYRIFVSSIESFVSHVGHAMEGIADPQKRVRRLIAAHMEQLLRLQKRNATMITEMRSLAGKHRAEIAELRRGYAELAGGTLLQAQAAGILRDDIPARFLNLALLNLLNWVCLWYDADIDPGPGELGSLYSDLFLQGTLTAKGRAALEDARGAAEKPKPKNTRRKASGANDTSIRVLKVAAALFAHKGYHLTTTREIGERLGIRKASLYYHVDSKEDLLFTICKTAIERIRQDVCVELATKNPVQRLRGMIAAHVGCVLRDQDMHTVALADMNSLSAARRKIVRDERSAYEALLEDALTECQRQGYVRTDIPMKYLKMGLLGLMDRVQTWYRPSGELSPDQIRNLIANVFLRGACAPRS